MEELSMAELGNIGVNCIEKWFRENGFENLKKNSIGGIETEIEADGKMENILVHVVSTQKDGAVKGLSKEERTGLLIRAARSHRVAYLAFVTIAQDKNLWGEITWEKLRLLD